MIDERKSEDDFCDTDVWLAFFKGAITREQLRDQLLGRGWTDEGIDASLEELDEIEEGLNG